MAFKMFCDRCGAEINPPSFARYADVRRWRHETGDEYALCESCADELKQWLNGKKWENET